MDAANASPENPNSIPSAFRGLRILLLDSDTASLLDLAAKLEDYSYRVIALQLPTIALSILEEHADRFDLVMADINMKEMDCFKFLESVQLIKNFPVILMSADLRKDMVEEAMRKGACFFMSKPISPKNIMNVWQHIYRKTKHENSEKNDEKEAEPQGGMEKEKDNALETEQIGDGNDNDRERLIDKNKPTQLTGGIRRKSCVSTGEIKWKRTEDDGTGSSRVVTALPRQLGEADTGLGVEENQELTDFNYCSTGFLRLLQETDTAGGPDFRENPHFHSLFPTKRGGYSHFHAREKSNDSKEGQGS